MKTIKSLSLFAIISLIAFSCSKENKESNDVEVHVVDDNQMHQQMSVGNKLDVEVVNELDPICGMDNATHLKDTANYKGKTYGFCNTMCKEKFLENPTQYVNE